MTQHNNEPPRPFQSEEAPTELIPRLIEDTHVLPSLERIHVGIALGQEAILAAQQVDSWNASNAEAQYSTVAHELAGEHYLGSFAQQVANVRGSLASLSPEQKLWIEPYLAGCAGRAYQGRHALQPVERGDKSWSEWLPSAADEHLMDFVSAHLDILQEQTQSPAFLEAVAEAKNKFIGGVRSLIIEDKLHPEVDVAVDAIKQTKVLLGDYWDTELLGMSGYHYEGGDNYIVLGQGFGGTQEEVDRQLVESTQLLVVHEAGHIKIAHHLPRWRKEAVVHHIAMSILHGESEIMNPDRRTVCDGVYEEERRLLHTVHTRGRYDVPIAVATRAASAQASYEQEDTRMRQSLDDTWEWPGMLESVDNYVAQAEAWLRGRHPDHTDQDIEISALKMAVQQLEAYANEKFGREES